MTTHTEAAVVIVSTKILYTDHMETVLTTPIDSEVAAELERASARLGVTRRQFIEDAIREHAKQREGDRRMFWDGFRGIVNRDESPEESVAQAHALFANPFPERPEFDERTR
ncbi:hypothetical protein AYO38_08430 [bacterium SCGC AG-212-C10]|nr:hypothetical protein AYO38_08430 [bacterium SCGC AG-212-C10]